jgi:hypothetical protein
MAASGLHVVWLVKAKRRSRSLFSPEMCNSQAMVIKKRMFRCEWRNATVIAVCLWMSMLLFVTVANMYAQSDTKRSTTVKAYINVVPGIPCRLCVENQQRYIMSDSAREVFMAAPFESDSLRCRIKAKMYASSLLKVFPAATFLFCSDSLNQLCRRLTSDGAKQGVVVIDSNGSSKLISYDEISNGLKK